MATIIHQAICGERNRAWGLLGTTLKDNSLAKKIAFQTDLQDSPPSGLLWSPVIRGFTFGDYFLLIKTYPDNSPDVRNGRVFSHCLIVDKADLSNIYDISSLLVVFNSKLDKTIRLEPIILTPEQQGTVVLKDPLQFRFNKVIQSFIKFTDRLEPIVWIGQKDFEIAVCKLWELLSSSERENFNFGINFNPNQVAKETLNFIVIPENSEGKFENKGFIIIRKEDTLELTEFTDRFLAGETNAISRIEKFISAIEANTPTIKEVSIIAKAISTFENIEKENDLRMLNTLSNIIAKFSPEANKGIAVKLKLIERISLLIDKANKSEIFLLRNFQTKSFKESEKVISYSIVRWCSNFLLNEKQNQKVSYAPYILQILEAQKSNWLIKLVTEKTNEFLSNVTPKTARIVWRWIKSDVSVLNKISDEIQNTKEAEMNFCESFTNADNTILSEVKSFAVKRNWIRLHAIIVKSQFDFEIAIKEQIKIDSDQNSLDGISIISEGAEPKVIIDFTVINGDMRLINLSGTLCKADKKLLLDIKIENNNWQEIWLAGIDKGNETFDGIKEPQKTVQAIFDLLINGRFVNESLLEKISETNFANVLNYPNRSKIWSKLSKKTRGKFLEKTSEAFLYELSKNSTVEVPSESPLSDYIISNGISTFLYYNRDIIKNVLPIFNTYSQIPENIIKDYVSNYTGTIDAVDATQLGQLTNERKYSGVAYTIFQKAQSEKKFKIALGECYKLLDLFARATASFLGLISKVGISEDEWWTAFTQLSYTLYEEGPTQNKIWTQANGEGYDLETKGSGKEIWIAALQKLRKKECAGDITVKKLLKAMLEENKKNGELKTLKELWNKI